MCNHNIISRNEKNRSKLVILQSFSALCYIFRKWEHFQITKFNRVYMAGGEALPSNKFFHTNPLNISEIWTANEILEWWNRPLAAKEMERPGKNKPNCQVWCLCEEHKQWWQFKINVGNVKRICMGKSCWIASLALQQLFSIQILLIFLRIKLPPIGHVNLRPGLHVA